MSADTEAAAAPPTTESKPEVPATTQEYAKVEGEAVKDAVKADKRK